MAQKDSRLFDLESSLAVIEAEANHRIQKAERDAANELKVTKDELRRVQKEVDTKMLTIAKLKKRKWSISGGSGKTTSSPMNTTTSRKFTEQLEESNIHVEFIDTSSTKKISTVSPLHDKDRIGNTSISKSQPSFKATQNVTRNENKINSQSQFASHLLSYFEIIYSKIFGSTKDKQLSTKENENVNKLHVDVFKLRHLLQIYATEEPTEMNSTTHANNSSRTPCILSITKELICLFVARIQYDGKKQLDFDLSRLQIMFLSLSILHEICTINAEARQHLLNLVCTFDNGSYFHGVESHTLCTSSRIRGLSSKQKRALLDSSRKMRNLLPDSQGDRSNVNFWNETHASETCHHFVKSLIAVICSINPFHVDADSKSVESSLKNSLSAKCASFLMSITHDVKTDAATNHAASTSYEQKIWMHLFDHFFPTLESHDEKGKDGDNDFFFQTILRKSKAISRQNYLLKNQACLRNQENDVAQDLDENVSWRMMLMQFLCHLVSCSKTVRKTIFERKVITINPNFKDDTLFARRLFSVLLDDLQTCLLPQIKLLRSDSTSNRNGDRINDLLSLIYYVSHILVLLCETKQGRIMMQTQMKVGQSHENVVSDSISGVAMFVDLLESTLYALVLDQFKQQLCDIVSNCFTFFYMLLGHNQEKIRMDGQKMKSFRLILSDAERLRSLQACCKMVVNYHSHNLDKKFLGVEVASKRAKIILLNLS